MAATRLTLGFHMRLLRLWEWLTFIPKETPLLQYEHFAILVYLSNFSDNAIYDNRLEKKMQAENYIYSK